MASELYEMIAVMHELMTAKRTHDIDRLLELYSVDCVLEQPSLGVRSVGHDAIRPGLELFALVFPDDERDFDGAAVDGGRLVSWGTARMTVTGEIGGHTPNGRRAEVTTFVVDEFDADGRRSF